MPSVRSGELGGEGAVYWLCEKSKTNTIPKKLIYKSNQKATAV